MTQAQSTHPLRGHHVRGMGTHSLLLPSSPPPPPGPGGGGARRAPPPWPVGVGSLRDSAPSDCEGDWGTQRLLSVCSKEEIALFLRRQKSKYF